MQRSPVLPAAALLLIMLCPPVLGAEEGEDDEVLIWAPFPFAQTQKVGRGNNAGSHVDDANRYAVDFRVPVGTPIHSSCNGEVVLVHESTAGHHSEPNVVVVERSDGLVVDYAHLMEEGAAVEMGDHILAGDLIGWSGDTGYTSEGPHLHVNVRTGLRGISVPWRFHELSEPPKAGDTVTSMNYSLRKAVEPIALRSSLYDLCVALDAREAIAHELAALPTKQVERKELGPLKAIKGRPDLAEMYVRDRDNLTKRYVRDANSALSKLEAHLSKGAPRDAVAAAVFGSRDFKGAADLSQFRKAWSQLRSDPEYADAWKALEPRRKLREKASRAIRAEFAAHRERASKVRKAWTRSREAWEQVIALVDEAQLRTQLTMHVEELGRDSEPAMPQDTERREK